MARLTDEERELVEHVRTFMAPGPWLTGLVAIIDRLDSEPPPEGDDLAAVRAEGRRLLADFHALGTEDDGFRRDKLIDFWYDHADALLADPPDSLPEGGTRHPVTGQWFPSDGQAFALARALAGGRSGVPPCPWCSTRTS